jgi:hypothetical protein
VLWGGEGEKTREEEKRSSLRKSPGRDRRGCQSRGYTSIQIVRMNIQASRACCCEARGFVALEKKKRRLCLSLFPSPCLPVFLGTQRSKGTFQTHSTTQSFAPRERPSQMLTASSRCECLIIYQTVGLYNSQDMALGLSLECAVFYKWT